MRTTKTPGGWLLGLALVVVLAWPAEAEVRVFLLDRTEPIITAEVFEEGPWLFYREGESPYLFTVARHRVERLEIVRDGAVQILQIAPPGQVAFRDFRRHIVLSIAELQDARVEELRGKFEEEVGKMASAASAVTQTPEVASELAELAAAEAFQTLQIQRDRAELTRRAYERAKRVLDRTLEQISAYQVVGPRPRFYFYR